jgi:hypothetical protein
MKVIVCGGRDYSDRERLFNFLDDFVKERGPITLLIEGGATGADTLARAWAIERNVKAECVRADWKKLGDAAGPVRNAEMLKLKPDIVIAFPGGRGTANMKMQTLAAGVPLIEVDSVTSGLKRRKK